MSKPRIKQGPKGSFKKSGQNLAYFKDKVNCKVPREVLKTEGEAQGFQHFPRDPALLNDDKIMFNQHIYMRFTAIKITVY